MADSSRRSAPRPAGRGRSRPRTSPAAKTPRTRSRAGGARSAERPGPGRADGRTQGRAEGRASRRTKLTGRAAALVLVACALVLALTYPVQEYFAQRAQIDDMRQKTAEQRERVDRLQEQRARWNDPAFVKAQARDRLHFVMPGETGYVAVPSARPSKAPR